MIITIGVGLAALAVTGYLGRKGWLAFHRAVGIAPGTLKYIEPAQLPPPEMIQLDLSAEQLQHLPASALEYIQRIDFKADIYQAWRTDIEQSGHTLGHRTLNVTEEEFIIEKLLTTRLPQVIESYQMIARHDNRLQRANISGDDDATLTTNQAQALELLIALLIQIESKLDALLSRCQQDSIQEMQAMQRYLDDRA